MEYEWNKTLLKYILHLKINSFDFSFLYIYINFEDLFDMTLKDINNDLKQNISSSESGCRPYPGDQVLGHGKDCSISWEQYINGCRTGSAGSACGKDKNGINFECKYQTPDPNQEDYVTRYGSCDCPYSCHWWGSNLGCGTSKRNLAKASKFKKCNVV